MHSDAAAVTAASIVRFEASKKCSLGQTLITGKRNKGPLSKADVMPLSTALM